MKKLLKVSLAYILIFGWGFSTLLAQNGSGLMAEYPEEKEEIKQTMNEIVESVKAGNIDKLISFHAYGPKFTEFKQGAPRNGGEENEAFEREVFGSVKEAVKMDAKDMKIAVYHGNVAVVTFHSDFHLKFEENVAVVNDQISLVFAKNGNGEWKIVHEHHSPLSLAE
ncbi:nuclear transport factor 2 family protein [Balneolaceae bacterium YR4-1]|uniref:Nuclear transport factor 2 family protein n=1 Tax=Halalkalibaculum roseum TaxID=2709311 RepID=A0A6M1SUQ5_9BACT|nr:nuclear transport factor 2 family protein [Halalkalibaculum roseum]NGP75848.1 nuclear transport factor 2 family protein [Halalkalibaculum roseum]